MAARRISAVVSQWTQAVVHGWAAQEIRKIAVMLSTTSARDNGPKEFSFVRASAGGVLGKLLQGGPSITLGWYVYTSPLHAIHA